MSFATFSAASTGAEVAAALKEHIAGKTVLITGGSVGGIGLECAAELVKHAPRSVILTARTPAKLDEAVAHIRQTTPDAALHGLVVDLCSFKQVRQLADQVNALPEIVDVIIHNAAVAACPVDRTEDGIAAIYQSNVYSPFLLTKLLLPKMLTAPSPPRVVFIAGGMQTADTRFRLDDPAYKDEAAYAAAGGTFGTDPYSETKRACTTLAFALARRARGSAVAVATSPGWVYTGLSRSLTRDKLIEMGFIDKDGVLNPNFRSKQQGIAPYIVSAFHPDESSINGAFVSSACKPEPEKIPAGAKGEEIEDATWRVCEDMVGEKFTV